LLAAQAKGSSLAEAAAGNAASPWTRLRELVQEEAQRRYVERESRLSQLGTEEQKEHKRRMVLTLKDFVSMCGQAVVKMTASLPLRLRGDGYEYVHKSVFEYCAARQLLREARRGEAGMTIEELQGILNWAANAAPQILLFVDELLQPDRTDQQSVRRTESNHAIETDQVQQRIACVFDAVGEALEHFEKYEKALAYHRKALAIEEKILGTEHTDTAMSYNNLGVLLQDLGRHEEALKHYGKALAIFEKVLGTEHTDTATSYNSLGSLLEDLGRHEEALAHYRKALDIAETLHHPDANLYREAIASLGKSVDAHTKRPPAAQDPRQHQPPRPKARRSTQPPQDLLPRVLQSDTDEVEETADDDDPEDGGSSADDGKVRRGSRRKCDVM
jgi:tetratricopeptide (TPR) repeat protein